MVFLNMEFFKEGWNSMRKLRRRLMKATTAFVVSASFICSSCVQPYTVQAKKAAENNITYHEIEDTFTRKPLNSSVDKQKNAKQLPSYKPGDEVKVIVTLKENTLLDNYIVAQEKAKKDIPVEDYLNTSSVKKQKKSMIKEQSELEAALNKDKDIDKVDVLCNYTTIVNGFTAKIKYEDLDELKEHEDIEDVAIVEEPIQVEPAKPSVDEEEVKSQLDDLKAQYTGKGTVIAVLDTGADITHEVFAGDVPEAKLDSTQIESLAASSQLHVPAEESENVYKSTKIPFAYDYGNKDTDVCPTQDSIYYGNEHGNHVASIAAANETETMSGKAKDAQLMVMKVFDDEGFAEDEFIFSALEDAVVLGADVINMSLGIACGFSKPITEVEQQIIERIDQAGITVMAAAGNSYDGSLGNSLGDRTLAETPDNGVVDSPASYESCTAVASVAGGEVIRPYFNLDGEKIPYNELAIFGQNKFSSLAGTPLEYCVVEGEGGPASYDDAELNKEYEDEDGLIWEEIIDEEEEEYQQEDETSYESIDVTGKVVLLDYSLYYGLEEQIAEAANRGAIAIMIASPDEAPLTITLYDIAAIPVIGLGKSDAETLKQQENKIIEAQEGIAKFREHEMYQPSEFSSLGVTADLKLKPEIAEVGESVYAALPFGHYGSLDGTSMATPAMAGNYAVVKEFINKNAAFSNLTSIEKNKLAMQFLMSTAKPLPDENGVYYSPRKVGSGLADVAAAVHTKAYLYTDENVETNQKPKLNLYDDPEKTGTFTSSFHIKNFGDEALTYQLTYQALKENTEKDDQGTYFLTGTESLVNDKTQLSILVNGEKISGTEVTVEAGQKVNVEVTFTLNDELKKEYDEQMKNGGYFEGYIQLNTPASSTLSIPFLGFYGDWTSAPLFEGADIYQCNPFIVHANFLQDDYGNVMGINPYDEKFLEIFWGDINPYTDPDYYKDVKVPGLDKIIVSPNGDSYFDGYITVLVSQLRAVKDVSCKLTDSEGNVVSEMSMTDVVKPNSFYFFGIPFMALDVSLSEYFEEHGVTDGEVFNLTIEGSLAYERHEQNNVRNQLTYPIIVDVQKPKAKAFKIREEDGKRYLVMSASDAQYVSYAGLFKVETDNTLSNLTGSIVSEDEKGMSSEVKIDLSPLEEGSIALEDCILQVYDYGMNHSLYAFSDPLPVENNVPQVQNVKAVKQTDKSIKIQWDKVEEATHYEIFVFDQIKQDFVKMKTVQANKLNENIKSINGKFLKPGTEYQFKVRAAVTDGEDTTYGDFSDILYTATCTKRPELKVKSKRCTKYLSWHSDPLADGYEVFCSRTKNGQFSLDTAIDNSDDCFYYCEKGTEKYYYKVRTYKIVQDEKIYSEFSNVKTLK